MCPGPAGVYPRVYGGNSTDSERIPVNYGLSPRVRGKHGPVPNAWAVPRSIPACTGETSSGCCTWLRFWVYPRVYGGNQDVLFRKGEEVGLSPRVRGKRPHTHPTRGPEWSIPACTGETRHRVSARSAWKVYPRVYGGNATSRLSTRMFWGLSPRVRGKLVGVGGRRNHGRSIPACTGETNCLQGMWAKDKVYPRVYGGNANVVMATSRQHGLSPRVRGKLEPGRQRIVGSRSIPACTGETERGRPVCTRPTVYPRVYGGNDHWWSCARCKSGLSPRVRGKLMGCPTAIGTQRSIPACTGETKLGLVPLGGAKVYPRVYGGNRRNPPAWTQCPGLSPRVRGKRMVGPGPETYRRSIPACTGETDGGHSHAAVTVVYPRVYGGNSSSLVLTLNSHGLSPRVRGKPLHGGQGLLGQRSIPACTGETAGCHSCGRRDWVYPRVYGGNRVTVSDPPPTRGLSPRVRGKPCPA